MHLTLTATLSLLLRSHCHAFGSSPASSGRNISFSSSGTAAFGWWSSRADKTRSIAIAMAHPSASSARQEDIMGSGSGSEQETDDQFRIGYLSDIEGHWEYFLECVQRSNVLDWEEAPTKSPIQKSSHSGIKFQRLKLRPNTHFVYGGDTVDKGPGDIRLVRALVSLKKRYPTRVHLLVGNRDLNKIRLPSELSESDMKRDVDEIGRPFWDRKAMSLKEHLEELKEALLADADGNKNAVPSLEELNTRAERLRYMLKHTLGCPDTFEFRREEVQLLTHIYGEYPLKTEETHYTTPIGGIVELNAIKVSDEEVVDSFLHEMSDGGSLHEYLNLAQIAAIIGNTIFVHGAIDSLTMKYVPCVSTKFHIPTTPPPQFDAAHTTTPIDGKLVENVHEWVQSLNEYMKHGLKDFADRPYWNAERTSRGGEGLLAIQNRPSMWGRSVVCNSYADGGVITTVESVQERKEALQRAQEKLDPLAFEGIASNVLDPIPAKWLLDHGIKRIVVGHKPTGDSPAVLNSKYTGVEVVAVDTSYSHRRDLNQDENIGTKIFGESRGNALAMVEIRGNDSLTNWLVTSGVMACGTEYANNFPILSRSSSDDKVNRSSKEFGDPLLGRKLSGGWWVKAAVPPNYHLCRGSGRVVEYDIRKMHDVINAINNS